MRHQRVERHRPGLAQPAGAAKAPLTGGGRGQGRGGQGAAGDGIRDHPAVAHLDHAAGAGSHVAVMGDDDDRMAKRVQLIQQCQQLLPRAAVQRAGRLIGKDHLAAIHQRPRD